MILLMTLLPTSILPWNFTNINSAQAAAPSPPPPTPFKQLPNSTSDGSGHAGTPFSPDKWASIMKKELKTEHFTPSVRRIVAKALGVSTVNGHPLNAPNQQGQKVTRATNGLNVPIEALQLLPKYNPSIAMDPQNAKYGYAFYEVWNGANDVCGVAKTSDGGKSWTSPVTIAPLVGGTDDCEDPVVRWSPDATTAYFVYLDIKNPGATTSSVRMMRDTCAPNGCWGALTLWFGTPNVDFSDSPWVGVHEIDNAIVTNQGGVNSQSSWAYVVFEYENYVTGAQYIEYIQDSCYFFACSWYAPMSTYPFTPSSSVTLPRVIGGMHNVAYGGGDVLVCWYNSRADYYGKFDIQCRHMVNTVGMYGITRPTPSAGVSFELPYYLCPYVPLNNDLGYEDWWTGMAPSVGVSPDGRAHITFTSSSYDPATLLPIDKRTNCGDIRYFDSKSWWNGVVGIPDWDNIPIPPATTHASWNALKTIVSGALAQGFPTISVQLRPPFPPTALGYRLYVFYYDAKNSPATCAVSSVLDTTHCYANTLYDTYMTTSDNGGTTFLTPTRITDQSSVASYYFLESYIDSSATGRVVWVIWIDHATELSVFDDSFQNVYGQPTSAL